MPSNTVPMIECQGTHLEMGQQQGEKAWKIILRALEIARGMDAVQHSKPKFVPAQLVIAGMGEYGWAKLHHFIKRNAPNQYQRIKGIALGSGVREKILYGLQYIEMVQSSAMAVPKGQCTTVGVTPERSATGEPVIARNYDLMNKFDEPQIARINRPSAENCHTSIDFTEAPIAGNYNGINDAGLCIVYNMVQPIHQDRGLPPTIIVQEALERCTTTQEAIKFIEPAPRGRGTLYTICDESGSLAVLETSTRYSAVRQPEDGITVTSNHFLTPEMKPHDVPGDWVYGPKAIPELRGVPFHQSHWQRYKRACELVMPIKKVTEEDLKMILRDHGAEGVPSNDTVCRHGPASSTLASVIMYPRRREMQIVIGKPCQNEYVTFNLD